MMANGGEQEARDEQPEAPTLAVQKLQAEIDKVRSETEQLRAETDRLRAEAKQPWAFKVLLTALLTSIGAGVGGYFFGDSLEERSKAEVRREVLKIYFGTENTEPGKRKQILNFSQGTLARNDAELGVWLTQARAVVEEALKQNKSEIAALRLELAKTENAVAGASSVPVAAPPVALSASHQGVTNIKYRLERLKREKAEAPPD